MLSSVWANPLIKACYVFLRRTVLLARHQSESENPSAVNQTKQHIYIWCLKALLLFRCFLSVRALQCFQAELLDLAWKCLKVEIKGKGASRRRVFITTALRWPQTFTEDILIIQAHRKWYCGISPNQTLTQKHVFILLPSIRIKTAYAQARSLKNQLDCQVLLKAFIIELKAAHSLLSNAQLCQMSGPFTHHWLSQRKLIQFVFFPPFVNHVMGWTWWQLC